MATTTSPAALVRAEPVFSNTERTDARNPGATAHRLPTVRANTAIGTTL